jgi:hypothetical protein
MSASPSSPSGEARDAGVVDEQVQRVASRLDRCDDPLSPGRGAQVRRGCVCRAGRRRRQRYGLSQEALPPCWRGWCSLANVTAEAAALELVG